MLCDWARIASRHPKIEAGRRLAEILDFLSKGSQEIRFVFLGRRSYITNLFRTVNEESTGRESLSSRLLLHFSTVRSGLGFAKRYCRFCSMNIIGTV